MASLVDVIVGAGVFTNYSANYLLSTLIYLEEEKSCVAEVVSRVDNPQSTRFRR